MRLIKLRELSSTKKGEYGIGASATFPKAGFVPYLRITDITDDGYVSFPLPTSIDPNAYPNWRQYLLKEGDIVFARTGNSTGRNYYCSELNGQVVYAGFLIKFSISSPDVLPRFVGYYCQSESYWKQVRSRFTGSTRANLNAEQYGELEIPVVSLEKQRHIVDAIASLLRESS